MARTNLTPIPPLHIRRGGFFWIGLIVMVFLGNVSFGQIADSVPLTKPDPKAKRYRFYPLPTVSYAPETHWAFGAVLQSTLRFFQDSATRYSTAKAEITFSTKSQIIATLEWQLTSQDNKFILLGDNQFLKFPELFWGVGRIAENRKGELYQANRLELYNELDYQFARYFYAGVLQRLQSTYNVQVADSGLFIQDDVRGRQGGTSSGLGLSLFKDSRDRLLNPSPGRMLAAVRQTFFQPVLGSRHSWTQTEIDLRYYIKLHPKWTLALQTYNIMQLGNPPFRMMALMGSDVFMRGYYQGRYRDRNLHTAQAEVRYPICKWLRGVAFAGWGDIAAKPFQFDRFPKPSLGGGLRVLVDKAEATYMRFDYATGSRGNQGFYIGFGEAF